MTNTAKLFAKWMNATIKMHTTNASKTKSKWKGVALQYGRNFKLILEQNAIDQNDVKIGENRLKTEEN